MYCFRCGRKLPGREINCPDCDTPQKKRRRRHKRMVLGLFIFLAGAFTGSFFDTYIFKGEAWKHSFLNEYFGQIKNGNTSANVATGSSNCVPVEMKYTNKNVATEKIETENTHEIAKLQEALFPSEAPSKTSDSTANGNVTTQEALTQTPTEKQELLPVEGVPSEIAEVLSAAPENVSKDVASVTEMNNSINEVEIVEEQDSDLEVSQTVSADEASGSASLFTEAAPVPETEPAVEAAPVTDGHLVYKNVSLLESASGDSYHAFMAKDGKELVFSSSRYEYNGKPTFQCFIKSPSEKAKAERVFEWKGNVWTPELTPDNNMIIFSSDSIQKEHIFLYDRKSGNSMALTSGKTKNMMPCISPDGKRIAFVSNRGDGRNRIWMMDIFNKNNVTQITKGAVDDREPRWTPDGKSLVFTRIIEDKKISHIMKVNVDSNDEPVALVSANSRNWMADVSPDNKLLAYTRSLSPDGRKNVIVLQDLSSGKEEILNFPGISECKRPVWNVDGSGFVFHASKKSIKNLYQANFVRE